MKKVLFVFYSIFIIQFSFAQEKPITKMDTFISRSGEIVRFSDYNLPKLKTDYDILDVTVRKFDSKGDLKFFLRLTKTDKTSEHNASIEYSDLLEVIQSLETLIPMAITDQKDPSDYLENKFATEDGFQIGYYKSNNKIKWYMALEKYGSGNSVFFSDISSVKALLIKGKEKIESMQ